MYKNSVRLFMAFLILLHAVAPAFAQERGRVAKAPVVDGEGLGEFVQQMLAIRDEITARVLAAGTDFEDLRRAYRTKDEATILAAMGIGADEAEVLRTRLNEVRLALFERYPEVQSQVSAALLRRELDSVRIIRELEYPDAVAAGQIQQTEIALARKIDQLGGGFDPPCGSCDREVETFFDNLDSYLGLTRSDDGGLGARQEEIIGDPDGDPDCDYLPYTAALALCTLGGPIAYWPCAYVALCSFCEGGWVTSACELI